MLEIITKMTSQELAEAYLQHYRSGSKEDSWAFDEVVEACNDLESGIKVTLSLLAFAKNEIEISYIAAGPVEDILKWHGNKAIPYFENASQYSENVRKALAGVWINEKDKAFSEWERLITKFGYLKTREK